MRWIGIVLASALALAGPAGAEAWQRLDTAGIRAALSARAVAYAGGQIQDFRPDGRTLYQNGDRAEWGYWRAEGNRYCSQWPPREVWTCYALDQRGIELRFTSETGSESVGRYADLR